MVSLKHHDCLRTIWPFDGFSDDNGMLQLRNTLQTPDFTQPKQIGIGSTLKSLGQPGPKRLSPEFFIRPIYTGPALKGNPFEFVSALKYRRGIIFTQGPDLTEIYQVIRSFILQ
ncbi:hypothetical protein DFH28DRAFT_1136069 [Melampsora americana]|nr:hypothetical protein DFH28DRAFT_1136069 [Melampsora americana]